MAEVHERANALQKLRQEAIQGMALEGSMDVEQLNTLKWASEKDYEKALKTARSIRLFGESNEIFHYELQLLEMTNEDVIPVKVDDGTIGLITRASLVESCQTNFTILSHFQQAADKLIEKYKLYLVNDEKELKVLKAYEGMDRGGMTAVVPACASVMPLLDLIMTSHPNWEDFRSSIKLFLPGSKQE